MIRQLCLFFLLLLLFLCVSDAHVQVPKWFGDGMVLQGNDEYGARSFLNGVADPGESVLVQVLHGNQETRSYPTQADSQGDWKVQLDPAYFYGGGGALSIRVAGETNPADVITAHNVTFGDVFFCSGQSNMVFPLKLAFNATQEAQTLRQFPNFSFFVTARSTSPHPQWDLQEGECDQGNHKMCNRWVSQPQALADQFQFLLDFSAVCFLTVRDLALLHHQDTIGRHRPVALIQSAWGGTRVEAWMSQRAIRQTPYASKVPPRKKGTPNAASVLYNAMVHPWNHYVVRAVLWYQGEANADQTVPGVSNKAHYYSIMYQAMIADWRLQKGIGDFCWATVQLPPSVPAGTDPSTAPTGRMEIRTAQMDTQPHWHGQTDVSAVAVTLDLGGSSHWGIDHPPNKNEVARRLALGVLHAAYGVQEPLWTGPILTQVSFHYRPRIKMVLTFQHATAEILQLRDVHAQNIDGSSNDCQTCCAQAPPFEIQTTTTPKQQQHPQWHRIPYKNIHIETNKIILDLPAYTEVTAVRYAWSDYVECVLVNSAGLVASPFVHALPATTNASSLQATVPLAPQEHLRKGRREDDDKTMDNIFSTTGVSTSDSSSSPVDDATTFQSPPMGFNSWNFYHCNIDENTVKAIADAMVQNGMRRAGYLYVNIDDCWQVGRKNATTTGGGTILEDPARFPSGMKDLANYVHSHGLRLGVYTARGSRTCQGRPGSYRHEALDAQTYCDWGIDYVKVDDCGGSDWSAANTSWVKFRNAFDACQAQTGRPMVLSVEYCDSVDGCGEWIANVANLWRTTGDIQATWGSVIANIHQQEPMYRIAKPGHFNDPDMLQVGNVGLTLDEQYSHMALWCIAGAPLLVGTDLVHASKSTLEILTNPEVIAVNQDLGWKNNEIQGHMIGGAGDSESEVWCKRLADGSWAVVLLNTHASKPMDVTVRWLDLGLAEDDTAVVRDLWKKENVGKYKGKYIVTGLQPHQSAFVRVLSPEEGSTTIY